MHQYKILSVAYFHLTAPLYQSGYLNKHILRAGWVFHLATYLKVILYNTMNIFLGSLEKNIFFLSHFYICRIWPQILLLSN